MTKTERLFHIVKMLRVKKTATIDELAKECMVSSRTVYRDVGDLEDLGAAVYDNNIIRLTKVETTPQWDLTPEELDIMQFALRANPLSGASYFQGRMKGIEVKLAKEMEKKDGKSYAAGGFFLSTPGAETLAKKASASQAEENLSQFWKHLQNKRAVKITLKKAGRGSSKEIIARCKNLTWSNGKWWYECLTEVDRKPIRLEAGKVAKIQPQRRYRS